MGAVYRRGGGGSLCVDAVTAMLVVGVALMLQFVFYLAVSSACPYTTLTNSRIGNISYVITVDNSNTIGVDLMGGDQMLEQDQTQDQTQMQDQSQTASGTQNAQQTIFQTQTQDQDQDQEQNQNIMQAADDAMGMRALPAARERRWTLPSAWITPIDLSTLDWPSLDWSGITLSLCPLLGNYL